MREVLAAALLVGAVLVAAALGSHSPLDPSPFYVSSARETPVNLVGWLGATLSGALLSAIGLTAFLLSPLAAVLGWRLLRSRPLDHPRAAAAGLALVFVALPGCLQLFGSDIPYRDGTVSCGGFLGRAAVDLLGGFAGPLGRVGILVFVLLVGVLLASGVSLAFVVERIGGHLGQRWRTAREERARRRSERQQEKDRQRVLKRQMRRMESDEEYRGPVTVKELEGRGRFRIVRRVVEAVTRGGSGEEPAEPAPAPSTSSARKPRPPRAKPAPKPPAPEPVVQEEFDFVDELDRYDLPRPSFLEPTTGAPARDTAALMELSKLITDKCQEFRVRGEVVNIRTGPVITTFEFRLDPGVKISSVQNLSEDLALALQTESVRIDRIPGRATVGIEVPNPDPEVIRIAELINASEFQRATSLLTLCLGVDIRGKPFYADLARMPHLLIGGFTGSGKSVGINAMIMSILYKAKPDEVKFILVDPKLVELGVYADIPHLLTPIITDPKKAANALGWAVAEMDNRYRLLAALGVRNLSQYNQLVTDPAQWRRIRDQGLLEGAGDEADAPEPLPYIVIIIDELADLMLTSSRAVEESITRLAQKARAVGLHLVCATQRPSVDIVTGIIKANFSCRIAYKVRSKFDSRTILDIMGAEHLIGRGDMLFLPPGTSTLLRLHGALVTEKEIGTVVRYVKRFGKPVYQREVLTHEPLAGPERGGRRTVVDNEEELDDPMYEQAARLVVKTRKASASYVQRRLHLGYTRSARLLDMMEKERIVGPLEGSKGREVLVPPDFFGEVDETLPLDEEE